MLDVVSLSTALLLVPFDVTEHPWNPIPAKVKKPTTGNSVLHLLFRLFPIVFMIVIREKINTLF